MGKTAGERTVMIRIVDRLVGVAAYAQARQKSHSREVWC